MILSGRLTRVLNELEVLLDDLERIEEQKAEIANDDGPSGSITAER